MISKNQIKFTFICVLFSLSFSVMASGESGGASSEKTYPDNMWERPKPNTNTVIRSSGTTPGGTQVTAPSFANQQSPPSRVTSTPGNVHVTGGSASGTSGGTTSNTPENTLTDSGGFETTGDSLGGTPAPASSSLFSTFSAFDIFTIVTTIVSLILGFVFYFKSKSVRFPVFIYDHTLLQIRSHPSVTIFFQEEKVENLSRYRVLFFNKGKKEIRKQDIPITGFPKAIFENGVRVLSCSVLGESNGDIGFRAAKVNDTTVEIGFDYLNQNDGGVIEILFENNSNLEMPAQFKAPIIGARSWALHKYEARLGMHKIKRAAIYWGLSNLSIVAVIAGLVRYNATEKIPSVPTGLFLFIYVLIFIFIMLPDLWNDIVKPYRKSFPAWASKYFEA